MSAGVTPQIVIVDQNGSRRPPLALGARGLTLGREPDNNVQLDGQLVSRRHARIDWDGARVTVTDLGSSNGTLLGDTRLLANVPQEWAPGVWLRIGGFFISLQTTEASQPDIQPVPSGTPLFARPPFNASPNATTDEVGLGAPRAGFADPTRPLPKPPPSTRVRVTLDQNTLTVTPGQPAVVRVTLANIGPIVDHFTLTVEGVPAGWVKTPPTPTQLNPGAQATVVITVLVARAPENRAGEYPVTIRASSREFPGESGAEVALWSVLPFTVSGFAIDPARAITRGKAKYTLTLSNDSNTPAQYQFSGRDDEQALRYHFAQPLVALEPAAVQTLPLEVEAPRRWVGGVTPRRFTVQATESAGKTPPQTVNGELAHKALVPVWVPPLALAVLLALGFFIYKQLSQPPKVDLSPDGQIALTMNGQETLTWDSKHAKTLKFQPPIACDPYVAGAELPASGSCFLNLDKNPSFNTPGTYSIKLKADNRSNSSSDTVQLTVKAPAPDEAVINTFTATPPQVDAGAPVALAWQATNAKQVSLSVNGTEIALDPTATTYTDNPKVDTVYTLTITNAAGTQVKRSATVKVNPLPTPTAPAPGATAPIIVGQPTPGGGGQPGQTPPAVQTAAAQATAAVAAASATQAAMGMGATATAAVAGQTATAMAMVTPTPAMTTGNGSPLIIDGQAASNVVMGDTAGKVLYATVGTRLFRSDDGGRTWDTQTMRTAQPGKMIVALNNPDVLYVGDHAPCGQSSNAPFARSTDGGQTWETGFLDAAGFQPLLANDNGPPIIVAASCDLQYSPNGAQTWIEGTQTTFTTGSGQGQYDVINAATNSPDLNQNLAVALNSGGSCLDGGFGDLQIYDIGDPVNPFQFVTEFGFCGGVVVAWDVPRLVVATDEGVYVSDDVIGNWNGIAHTTGLEQNVYLNNPPDPDEANKQVGWTTVHIDPINHDRIWIGGKGGVFRSVDAGQTWQRITPDDVKNVQNFTISLDGALMFVVADGTTRTFTIDAPGQ